MKTKILALVFGAVALVNASATFVVADNEAIVNVPAGEETLLSATVGDVNNLTGKILVKTGGGMLINTNKFLQTFTGNIEVREGIFWVAYDVDLGTKNGKTVVSNGASLFCMQPKYLVDTSSTTGRWKDEPIELSGQGDGLKTFGALYFDTSDGKYISRFEKVTLNDDTTICLGARCDIRGTMNMNNHILSVTNGVAMSEDGIIDFSTRDLSGSFEPRFKVQNPGSIRVVGDSVQNTPASTLATTPPQVVTFTTLDNKDSKALVNELSLQRLDNPGVVWESVFEDYGLRVNISKDLLTNESAVFVGDVTINKALYVRTHLGRSAYEDSNHNLTSLVQNVHFKGPVKGEGKIVVRYNHSDNWDNKSNNPVAVSLWNNTNTINGIEVYNQGVLYLCNTSVLPKDLTLKCVHAYEVAAAGDATEKLINVSKIDCEVYANESKVYRGWTDFKWAKAIVSGFEKKGAGTANLAPSVITGAVNIVAGTLKVAAPAANEGELFADFAYDMAEVTIADAGTLDLSGAKSVIAKLNVGNGNEGKIVNGTAAIGTLDIAGQTVFDASEAAVEFGENSVVRLDGSVGKEVVVLQAQNITGLPKVSAAKKGWRAFVRENGNIKELVVKYDPGTVVMIK